MTTTTETYYAALGHDDDVAYAVAPSADEAIETACRWQGYTAGQPVYSPTSTLRRWPHLDVEDAATLFRAVEICRADYEAAVQYGYGHDR
ncbi:hypothetical protein [Candidatus Poriferisodalis sp.]|uniref:hypothetical protein n=1 Tax=Candidatus Poriferisodalis sp. TaxID=3101277 RepID=UPI003B01B2D9